MKNKNDTGAIKSTNAELSPLLISSIQNTYKKRLESSSIDTLIDYNLQQKEIDKETKKGYVYRTQAVINMSNKIIDYLKNTSLNEKQDKLISITNNSDSFVSYPKNTENFYYLEDVLNLITKYIKDKNQKLIIFNELKKLKLLNRIRKNSNKTPIQSYFVKKLIPLFLNYLNIKNTIAYTIPDAPVSPMIKYKDLTDPVLSSNNKKEEQIKKMLHNKILIEQNFKVKYVNSIEEYKDRNSLLYKSLPLEDQKLINTLLYIESKDLTINNTESYLEKEIFLTKKGLLKILTTFNSNELYSKNIIYKFKKRNTYNLVKNEKNIFSILESAFLSMDSLISKAVFSVKPNNVIINLFFFWKPSLNNKNLFYSNYYSKFALIYEKNLQNLGIIISKLLKKPINLQFTRLYYPYNDSNIFACFIGYMSFFIKFTTMSKFFLNKMNFFINKRKFFRLKYKYIPSIVTGINIKLGGRILTARTKRKVQSKKVQWGSLARTNNNLTTFSRFTNKNKTGAFSITVKNNTVIFN